MYRAPSVSVLSQASLNLKSFIVGPYVNTAFVEAQKALLQQGLRGLYVPGNTTYLLDPALDEIQLVLDDLHVWGENMPMFYHSRESRGFFQVIYAHRATVEGIRITLDPAVTRINSGTGNYAGSPENSRKSALSTFDSDGVTIRDIICENRCTGIQVTGYHTNNTGTAFADWKALSPAERIATAAPIGATRESDNPATASSLRRAQGMTRVERIYTDRCDMGILYHSVENIVVYDINANNTTLTKRPPHAIYAASNVTFDVGTGEKTSDKSVGIAKISKVRDTKNWADSSGKLRTHDRLVVSDWVASDVAAGISFINCDNIVAEGLTFEGVHGRLTDDPDGDTPDEGEDEEKTGYGISINGCRDAVFRNVDIVATGGAVKVRATMQREPGGVNRRRTPSGLIYNRNVLYKDITFKTNYANEPEGSDFDPDTFDPETDVPDIVPPYQVGANADGDMGGSATFENCSHIDAWGHYTSTNAMFWFRKGNGNTIINPRREGTSRLLLTHVDTSGHTAILDPNLIGSRLISDNATTPTRVITTLPISGDNRVNLADFGPLSTPEEVSQAILTAATVVGGRGPVGVIDLPSMVLTMGALAATDVSTGEGDGVRLTAAMSGITFRGNNTVLKPETNEIVMFSIVGAENITFEGIHFDNGDNGLLTDQFKPTTQVAGGGIAGLGNAANSAIKQFYGGANATITSGTYDDGTGVIVLTMSAAGTFTVGDRANLYSLTGTGAYASLNDTPWLITAATTTVVTIAGTAGLGASTITGGSLHTYKAKSHVKVRDCEFTEFHTSIGYFGNQSNTAELVGDLLVKDVKFTGCVFGVLCQQPRTLSFTDFEFNDGQNSLNDSGVPQTNDPGHALYFANRNGAYPESIIVTNARGTNNRSSLIKIRKGNSVVMSDIAVYASHRGVECWNTKGLTTSNITVILADVDGAIDDDGLVDTNASGFEITDCGNYEVDEIFVNRSGCNAWGVRVRESSGGESWQNKDGRIKGVTVKDDSSASTGKAFVVIGGQTDLDIVAPIARLTANTAHAKEVVDLNDCTRVHVHRPKRRSAAASNPTGSDRLVNLDADCSACVVEYTREDMDTAPTANTVVDAGTGTKIIRVDGEQSGTWTPTLAFATAGDGVVTVNSSDCLWFKCGPRWRLVYNIDFTTNAYTTASGNLRLTGTLDVTGNPALPAAVTANARAAVGIHQKIVGTANDIGIGIDTGNNYMTLRRSVMAGAGAALDTANFPASTANYILGGEISLLAAET